MYVCATFCLCLSVDGHLGCFHMLSIMNNVSMNIGVQTSVRLSALSSLEFILGWLKRSFKFFHNVLQKNLNEFFDQSSVLA